MKNKPSVKVSKNADKKMGDKSHLKSVMGKPKGADVKGHKGKMGKNKKGC